VHCEPAMIAGDPAALSQELVLLPAKALLCIYDAFFPVSALPLAYLCRMLAIRV
jgi:hypothetical protein